MQRKRNIGINQYNTFKLCQYITQFGLIGFQELSTCRNIIEQVLYLEITTLRTRNRFLTIHFGAGYTDRRTQLLSCHSCTKFHLCHCSNRSQCFPTESHGLQSKQIGRLAYFRCSMTFKSQTSICFRHPLTIINHLNGSLSGISNQHINMFGTGIHCIFYQFLNNRSRPLNYFTGCNLIGYRIGKQTYNITHRYS